MSAVTIYALPVRKGILALCRQPGARGDYRADLAHIADWRPSIVISMTTNGEMADHGASKMGMDFAESGIRWFHLPVPDMSVPAPNDASDDALDFETPLRLALTTLNGGGRVLVHCLGGCGRSGMMALRLMIMAGEDPDAAFKRLRAVRPCAVETEAQRVWACQVALDTQE